MSDTVDTTPDLIDFSDLAPKQIKVKIKDKSYILLEASGDVAKRYKNACANVHKIVNGRMAAIGNVADIEPKLVSWCLYHAEPDGSLPLNKQGNADSSKLVPEMLIASWPSRVQRTLFNTIKEISELNETDNLQALKKQRDIINRRIKELEGDGTTKPADTNSKNELESMPESSV